MVSAQVEPGLTLSGQRARNGMRCPLSKMSALRLRKRPLEWWLCLARAGESALGEQPLLPVKDDQSVLSLAVAVQGVEHAADRRIDFMNPSGGTIGMCCADNGR